ncbi:MAG: hypothetical protein Q4A16_09340 [Lautropia sp.]|nr:hypothetical protein [Lautropia sp.]
MERSSLHPHQHLMKASPDQSEQRQIRARGAIELVIGGVIGALALAWLVSTDRSAVSPWDMIGCAMPLMAAAAGLVELGSGVSLLRFDDAWPALRSWQRVMFGVLILMTTMLLLMGGVVLAF